MLGGRDFRGPPGLRLRSRLLLLLRCEVPLEVEPARLGMCTM